EIVDLSGEGCFLYIPDRLGRVWGLEEPADEATAGAKRACEFNAQTFDISGKDDIGERAVTEAKRKASIGEVWLTPIADQSPAPGRVAGPHVSSARLAMPAISRRAAATASWFGFSGVVSCDQTRWYSFQ